MAAVIVTLVLCGLLCVFPHVVGAAAIGFGIMLALRWINRI